MILGIDEVGRGPWAGPLVVGAVCLNGAKIAGLSDSKKLSKKRRETLNAQIRSSGASIGLGWITSTELDELGISAALVEATKRAVTQIKTPFHEIIIDGTINFLRNTSLESHVTTMKKADLLIPSVSAASIVAKVARDEFMSAQAELYPEYHFKNNAGYGTSAHKAAIEAHGITPLHRRSFAPIVAHSAAHFDAVTTKSIGDASETIIADELRRRGFVIRARNYRTKIAEIDIVAEKSNTLYFVEAKHRKTNRQGGGISAITPKKLQKMRLGVEVFSKQNRISGYDVRLAVATTTADPPIFEDFLVLE